MEEDGDPVEFSMPEVSPAAILLNLLLLCYAMLCYARAMLHNHTNRGGHGRKRARERANSGRTDLLW